MNEVNAHVAMRQYQVFLKWKKNYIVITVVLLFHMEEEKKENKNDSV